MNDTTTLHVFQIRNHVMVTTGLAELLVPAVMALKWSTWCWCLQCPQKTVGTPHIHEAGKWISIKPSKISQLVKCKSKGYLLEIDVKYPKELHNSYSDLPFMCK